MASKPKKELKKFEEIAQRPLIIDPDIVRLFLDLKESSLNAIIMAIVIQRIAHMTTKTKPLNLMIQELFDLFPFIDSRGLRKNVYRLREYGIWKNKPYRQKSGMASYENIKISFKAIAKLAMKVEKEQTQNELKAMCQKINKEKEVPICQK